MIAWAAVVGEASARPGRPEDAVDGVLPAWVVCPGSVGEVQACVREAAAAGLALVVSGAGAHMDVGGRPARVDVLLRLDRLARVVDHQAADMTVTVEAGCSLASLEATLAAAGQWLPLDPPRPAATTAGGAIAANLSGPLRASQGTVRDLLLGVRAVGADGAVVSGGGRVVKNVAGYDLPKLHVGALGTVGVIVEATFKVRPRPACEQAVVLAGPTAAVVGAALAARDTAVPPLWLEVAVPGLAGAEATAAVGLGGTGEEVAQGRALLGALGRDRGLAVREVPTGAALRAELGAFAGGPAAAILRAATLPTGVADVIARARAALPAAPCAAHVANGVVRVAVAEPAAVGALVAALRPALERAGGSLVVERASPEVKRTVDVWGDPGPGAVLMRRVKAAFDPAGTLAPGRFVGEL